MKKKENQKDHTKQETATPPPSPPQKKNHQPQCNTLNIHASSFKTISYSMIFQRSLLPSYLYILVSSSALNFPTWSIYAIITIGFSFCCWILLIFNTVKSDILFSSLALKKKVLYIHMVTIKKAYVLCVLQ